MTLQDSTIWVFVDREESINPSSIDGERASEDVGGSFISPEQNTSLTDKVAHLLSRKRVPLDAQALKAQINGLMQVIDDLFVQAEKTNAMRLDEVTLSVEVDAEGQIGIAGNGGKIGNTGGITMKFSRSDS